MKFVYALAITALLATTNALNLVRSKKGKDAYDMDQTTASQYDDMEQHKKFDYGVPEPETFEGVMLRRNKNKRDAYDLDPATVSQYDDMEQHKKFDYGVPEEQEEVPDSFEGAQIRRRRI